MALKEAKIEGYPVRVVGTTSFSVIGIVAILLALDQWVWPNEEIFEILFPLAEEYHLIGVSVLWVLAAFVIVSIWNRKYRNKKNVIAAIYAYAVIGLALLVVGVNAGGGLVRSPFSSFFPVGIAISIMVTSKWWHVVVFSIATIVGVVWTWVVSNHIPASPPPAGPYLGLFYTIFCAALVLGTIAGAIRLDEDDEKTS